MIAWDTVQTACLAFVNATVVGRGVTAVWRDQSNAVVYVPLIELVISGETSIGWDDIDYIDGANSLAPSVTGVREFSLELHCRARDQSALGAARNYLERVRSCTQHPKYSAILSDAGVSFLNSQPIQTIPTTYEGRRESVAVLEIRLCTNSALYDASDTVDYATKVGISVVVDGGSPIELTIPEA